jgi:hypothetical protein
MGTSRKKKMIQASSKDNDFNIDEIEANLPNNEIGKSKCYF